MNFLFNFLLIGGFSIAICTANSLETLKVDLFKSLYNNKLSLTDSKTQKLTLQKENGNLSETNNALIWKGKYNDETDVAIKIFWDQKVFDREVKILNFLGAKNVRPGLLPVYYHGHFLNKYFAIATELYDETLEDRFMILKKNNKKMTELDIILLYRRLADIFLYIHGRKVDHNDINPKNILLRGPNVFIGNFDSATLNNEGQRFAKSDFESIIYSLWTVAGMNQPKSLNLAQLANSGEAAVHAKVKAKCAYFEAQSVQKAFEVTVCNEILSKKDVPEYESINMVLQLTIVGLSGNANEAKFSWLPGVVKERFSRLARQLSSSSKK